MALLEHFLTQYRPDHVWLFLTDRCQLRCRHCFYRHKTGRTTLAPAVVRALFASLPERGRYQFILSGGEPLTEWALVRRLVEAIRRRYQGSYLALQTNTLLLTAGKIRFLKEHDVSLEIGIDGDEETTERNRPGCGGTYYRQLHRRIGAWQAAGGRFSATMTVRPDGVDRLFGNAMHLAALGLSRIEMHPAFLENWDAGSARAFMAGYAKVCAETFSTGNRNLVGREYSFPAKGVWDLLLMPEGRVLPSWVWLSFPERIRAQATLMDLARGHTAFLPQAAGYFRQLGAFLKKVGPGLSYRQLSNINIRLAMNTERRPHMVARVRAYLSLCDAIERMDCGLSGAGRRAA